MDTIKNILIRLAQAELASIGTAALVVAVLGVAGVPVGPSLAVAAVAKIGVWVNVICR